MGSSNNPNGNKHTAGAWTPLDIGKPSTVDYVIEGSTIVLNALKNAGSVTGVPFLSEAAGTAVRILTMAQEHIRQLLENLFTIDKFTSKRVDRGYVKRVIHHNRDKEQIEQFKVMLRQSLDLFGLQSTITIQDNVHRVLIAVETQREELRIERIKRQKEEEERKSEAEIKRIREEDERVARLEEEEKRRNENERLKKKLAKEKRRREREENRRAASENDADSSDEEKRKPSRRPGPQPQQFAHGYPYYPVSPPAPMSTPGYPSSPYAPSPYLLAPPTTHFGSVSLSNISGSAISLGGTTQNVVHHNNSGNVTNVEMSNMNNDNSVRYYGTCNNLKRESSRQTNYKKGMAHRRTLAFRAIVLSAEHFVPRSPRPREPSRIAPTAQHVQDMGYTSTRKPEKKNGRGSDAFRVHRPAVTELETAFVAREGGFDLSLSFLAAFSPGQIFVPQKGRFPNENVVATAKLTRKSVLYAPENAKYAPPEPLECPSSARQSSPLSP
ncbi:unnamed protein product [Cyclocybe aegerita]|uniref:Uncharacterized protein n=1 Tax=Cyclocybe aegerita TaxID=1973307 RepID=A0A8S0WIN7_CYCAE|nr:unnamed protein product [Cyclocybe aegerita]